MGIITVEFDSNNRPGDFDKSIKIFTNIDDKIIKLTVKGYVIATPGKLRKHLGPLDIGKDKINFGKMIYGSTQTKLVKLHNTLEDTIYIELAEEYDNLNVKIDPDFLLPAQYGKMIVSFDTNGRQYGKTSESIEFKIKYEDEVVKDDLLITAEIIEDFSKLTQAEKINSPKLNLLLENDVLVLKNLKPDKVYQNKIEIENTGKRDLKIRNIQTYDYRFQIEPTELSIKPGRKGSFIVFVKPSKKADNLKTIISIISNDPNNSKRNFTIVGKVDLPEGAVSKNPIIDVDVMKAEKLIESFKGNDDLVILDVRTKGEYEDGYLEGALNLDVKKQDFDKMLKLMDMKKAYLIYCKLGTRSKMAVDKMQNLGYKKIYHMYQGIEGWKKMGLKLIYPSR